MASFSLPSEQCFPPCWRLVSDLSLLPQSTEEWWDQRPGGCAGPGTSELRYTYYSTFRKLTFMLCFYKAGRVLFGINAFSKLENTEEGKHFLCCSAISAFGGYFRVATSEKCCVLLTALWLCLVFNELLQCWECCRTVLQRMVPQIGPFENVRKLFI